MDPLKPTRCLDLTEHISHTTDSNTNTYRKKTSEESITCQKHKSRRSITTQKALIGYQNNSFPFKLFLSNTIIKECKQLSLNHRFIIINKIVSVYIKNDWLKKGIRL